MAWFQTPRSPHVNVTAKMPPASQAKTAQGLEIVFRPDPTIWDGSFANNGWLQELPKPQNQDDLGQRRLDQSRPRRSSTI